MNEIKKHSLAQSALNNKGASWSGRFNEPVAVLVKKYTASISFDQRLAVFDIQGSVAHAQMLGAQKIISLMIQDFIIHRNAWRY